MALPVHVQVTVAPTPTGALRGEKKLSPTLMEAERGPAGDVGVGVGGGSVGVGVGGACVAGGAVAVEVADVDVGGTVGVVADAEGDDGEGEDGAGCEGEAGVVGEGLGVEGDAAGLAVDDGDGEGATEAVADGEATDAVVGSAVLPLSPQAVATAADERATNTKTSDRFNDTTSARQRDWVALQFLWKATQR